MEYAYEALVNSITMVVRIKGFGWKRDFTDPRDYTTELLTGKPVVS
jgi:hypothetical protein